MVELQHKPFQKHFAKRPTSLSSAPDLGIFRHWLQKFVDGMSHKSKVAHDTAKRLKAQRRRDLLVLAAEYLNESGFAEASLVGMLVEYVYPSR